MNLANQLKNRLPYPFETIAVAVTFSPRYKAVLSEAARISRIHRAKLLLIHVGALTTQQNRKLEIVIEACHIKPEHYEIKQLQGSVVQSILKVCKENVVDLLILGALKKESVLQHYVGSIARKISRTAKFSILLLPDPKERPKRFKNVVVAINDSPKSSFTLSSSVYISNIENATELYIVNEEYIPMFESAYADSSTDKEIEENKKEAITERKEKTNKLLDEIPGASSIDIKQRVIFGKPGHSIQVFSKCKKPDLLLVNSPKKTLGFLDRLFPNHLEYLLEDLPCNLLIVHSRGF